MKGVSKAVDLFKVFGIDPVKEKLYTGALASCPDNKNGMYWAIHTVDQDAHPKRWDVRIFYVSDGARIVSMPYWFKQGDTDTPNALAGVAISQRTDGTIVLTMTEDRIPGALFAPYVHELEPVIR
jgi:hypothetical protein